MIWKLITGAMTLLLISISLLFLDLFEVLTLKNGIIAGSVGVSSIMVLVLIDVFNYSQSNSRTVKNIK